MFPLSWSSYSCIVSLNIVKHFWCGTTLSSGGFFAFECIYLYTLTQMGLKMVRQKNNIYFTKWCNFFFFKSFFLSFFLRPKSEVLIVRDKQSAICTNKGQQYLRNTPRCASDLLVSLTLVLLLFQTASKPGWGTNGCTSNTGGASALPMDSPPLPPASHCTASSTSMFPHALLSYILKYFQ